MTVEEFMDLCSAEYLCDVEIFDLRTIKTVWRGHYLEIPDEYNEAEFVTFDIPSEEGCVVLNVMVESGEETEEGAKC